MILIILDIIITIGYLIIKYRCGFYSNPNPPYYQEIIAVLYLFIIDWPISQSINLLIENYLGVNYPTVLWGVFYQWLFSNLQIALLSHAIIAIIIDMIINNKKMITRILLCVILILYITSPFLLGYKI